jgi:hypothetical protein
MKILSTIICFALNLTILFSQITLTIEGTIVNNTETGTWAGVNLEDRVFPYDLRPEWHMVGGCPNL